MALVSTISELFSASVFLEVQSVNNVRTSVVNKVSLIPENLRCMVQSDFVVDIMIKGESEALPIVISNGKASCFGSFKSLYLAIIQHFKVNKFLTDLRAHP